MVLGELYSPRGLALETAKAVLEVEDPCALNVALGCTNGCDGCYGPTAYKKKREDWSNIRFPKKSILDLIRNQFDNGLNPGGVFLSFATDPLLSCNLTETIALCRYLTTYCDFPVAVLSKMGALDLPQIRHGATIVSMDPAYRRTCEPEALKLKDRLSILKEMHNKGFYTWVSMEPYPTPEIHEQKLEDVLEAVKFVDFIIFGKKNYDDRAKGDKARAFYEVTVKEFEDYCKSHGIRHHVKTDTLKFIGRME